MKTSLNAPDRLSREPVPALEKKTRKTALPNGYRLIKLMTGRAASLGVALGRAAVVTDSRDIVRVKEGAVIVFERASADLAMAMSKACAMLTEYGGRSAIASGYAKAYGIPAVVGITGLTRFIRNGDLVRVDGRKGTIEVMGLAG